MDLRTMGQKVLPSASPIVPMSNSPFVLPNEQIKDTGKLRAVGPIDFGVAAALTDDGAEVFVLDVQKLRQDAAGRTEFVDLVSVVAAFDALPIGVLHESKSPC
jgi:hypothetical protein